MNKSKHCELCDLQSFNFDDGIICSLTNKKGSFNGSCMKIKLKDKVVEKLIQVNEEYSDLKYVKKHSIINFITFMTIGLGVIFLSYLIGLKLLQSGVVSTLTITIFVIGLIVMGLGIGPMNFYRQKREVALNEKKSIDNLVDLYKINYDFDSKISTDIMGVKETESILTFNGKKYKTVKRL